MESNRRIWKNPLVINITVFIVIWGIFWSFYRHGIIHGAVSIILPPYAVYRGVAAFWEEPKWKEEYEQKSDFISILILSSYNGRPLYKNEYEMARYTNKIKNWISKLPRDEKEDLKYAAKAFGAALIAHSSEAARYHRSKTEDKPVNAESVEREVSRFSHLTGFMSVWDKSQSKRDLDYKVLRKRIVVAEPEEVDSIISALIDSTITAKMRINVKMRELFK